MLWRVYNGAGPFDAYRVQAWFERHGIRAFVRGDSLLRAPPPGEERGWPSVWVLRSEREAAEALLVDVGPPRPPVWVRTCPVCWEELDDTSCWMCGESLLPALSSYGR